MPDACPYNWWQGLVTTTVGIAQQMVFSKTFNYVLSLGNVIGILKKRINLTGIGKVDLKLVLEKQVSLDSMEEKEKDLYIVLSEGQEIDISVYLHF